MRPPSMGVLRVIGFDVHGLNQEEICWQKNTLIVDSTHKPINLYYHLIASAASSTFMEFTPTSSVSVFTITIFLLTFFFNPKEYALS